MAREPKPQKTKQLSLPLITDLELVKNNREPNDKTLKKPKATKARTKSVSHPIKKSEVTQSVIIDAMLSSYIAETNALNLQLKALSTQCEALKSRNDLLKKQNTELSRQLKARAVPVSTVSPSPQEAKPKQISKQLSKRSKSTLEPVIPILTPTSIPIPTLPQQRLDSKATSYQSLSISVSTPFNQNQKKELPAPPPLLFSYGHKKLPKLSLHPSNELKEFKKTKTARKT